MPRGRKTRSTSAVAPVSSRILRRRAASNRQIIQRPLRERDNAIILPPPTTS